MIKKIRQSCIIPSAACSVPRKLVKNYIKIPDRVPQVGDLIYGEIASLGFHVSLESISARIHMIHDRTRAVFVYGNRYATDHYEGFVPEEDLDVVDLLARGGVVGKVSHQNDLIATPTQIKVLGYICDVEGNPINTRHHVLIKPKEKTKTSNRSKLILCVGTSMNSGKSYTAAACCYAIASMDKTVRAAKITGTASLKDILLMQDCGAQHIADFTYFGYPSTYMLEMDDLLNIFNSVDKKYGNNPKKYLVFEFADGILQRETAMLLSHPDIQKRIHKLIFCASDAAGVSGGIEILKSRFGLVPDAISGLCSSSPLVVKEISTFTDIKVLKSMERDYKSIYNLIC